MVESMIALVLVDALMQQKAQCELFPLDEATSKNDAINKLGKKLPERISSL